MVGNELFLAGVEISSTIYKYVKDHGFKPANERFEGDERIDFVFEINTFGPSYHGDSTTFVTLTLDLFDTDEDGKDCFDTAISVHNNDCIPLTELPGYVAAAVEFFMQSEFKEIGNINL